MYSGLWIRFLKVKEELRVMREERTKKENAYRLMQRESKQCDVIQKELTKLKESKVACTSCFHRLTTHSIKPCIE
jgi:recombinational DNA repair protein RecR